MCNGLSQDVAVHERFSKKGLYSAALRHPIDQVSQVSIESRYVQDRAHHSQETQIQINVLSSQTQTQSSTAQRCAVNRRSPATE